jgi:hypothetical protein
MMITSCSALIVLSALNRQISVPRYRRRQDPGN